MAGRLGGPRLPTDRAILPQPEETYELTDEQPEEEALEPQEGAISQPSLSPDEYLQSACRIDPNALVDTEALQQEYLRVTEDMHYYLPIMLNTVEAAALAKLNCQETEAIARLAIRRKHNEERISEATIDAEVTISVAVQKARRGEIAARKEELRMKRVFSIIEEKASMLIQLGADMRQDKQQGLVIREKNPQQER